MRKTLLISGIMLSAGVICWGAQQAPSAPPRVEKAKPPVVEKVEAKVVAKPVENKSDAPPLTEKQSADEEAIRLTRDSLVKAYEAANAKLVASHFTADAEYVDEQGDVYQGREAIEESLAKFFKENPGCKLEMEIESIRFVSPGVAVEDGFTKMLHAEGSICGESHYTTVHVKADGKWQAASIREQAPKDRRQHRAQLEQLEWLSGDWIDEGDESIVKFNCQAVDNGNFLLRTFTIQIEGQEVMSGTQRIGWDALTGKLRAWVFDSEGGYADGFWHRDGDHWVLKLTGVTADGQTASSTSIYTFVNGHTMTWQSIDHEIGGVQLPDSEIVTIVRQAPAPITAAEHK